MYTSIDLKWFDKNRAKMVKTSIDNNGDEGKDEATAENLKDEIEEYEFDGDTINLCWTNELGYFSMEYSLTDDEMMEIVEHMKQKGERIRKLIKLAETDD